MANAFGLAANQASGLLAWASDHTEQSGRSIRAWPPATAPPPPCWPRPAWARRSTSWIRPRSTTSSAPGPTDPRPEELLDRLGERFFLMELAIKLYACCAFLHPALDAVLALVDEGAVSAEDVTAITLRFSHSGRSMIDQNELKSHRAQYILPIGLYNRKVVLDDILFEPRDTRIQALSEQTRVVGDDDLERFYPDRYPSIVELTTRDGAGRLPAGGLAEGVPARTRSPRLSWSASSATWPRPPWTPRPWTGSWRR